MPDLDSIRILMVGGPWWYEYYGHEGWMGSCVRVAKGSRDIKNLRADREYIIDIHDAAGCHSNDRIHRAYITTLNDIDNPPPADRRDGFNYHKHTLRGLGELGVMIGDCAFGGRVMHEHGWPDGGWGQHWHCPTD